MTTRVRARRLVTASLGALLIALLAGTALMAAAPAAYLDLIGADNALGYWRLGETNGTSQLSVGVTHTQYSLDSWGDPDAVNAGAQLLRTSAVYQNQHVMGWGGINPEPSPGVYDWSRLDARVALIRQTGGIPVITLCCAPDWMWGGAAGTTDWARLGTAPTPDHYADFAALARQVALRYPDVKHFLVWNELKGFWNADLNRWNYEGYTAMYNQVYDALKSISPDLKVGGPYVVVDSWGDRASMSHPSDITGPYGTLEQRPLDVISYWLANKHGADFVAVDAGCSNRDAVRLADEFTATQKFGDVAAWIRQRTDLPLWWAEWYCTPWSSAEEWEHEHQNAVMTSALIRMARSGAAVALRWEPQGVSGRPHQGNTESVWSDTRQPGGGQPFPFYYSQRALKEHFGPGTPLLPTTASSTDVEVLASPAKTLLVNRRAAATVVSVDGATLTLAGYEVRLLASRVSRILAFLPVAGR